MILFHLCTVCEVKNADNAIISKYRLTTNSVKFIQQQLHQCRRMTQLLAELLETIAVRHVPQSVAIKLHCSTAR